MNYLFVILFSSTYLFGQKQHELKKKDILKIVKTFNEKNALLHVIYNDSISYKHLQTDTVNRIQVISINTTQYGILKNVKWYYSSENLIYIQKTWQNTSTKTLIENEEFYINNAILIDWIQNKKHVDFNINNLNDTAINLIKYGQNLLASTNY